MDLWKGAHRRAALGRRWIAWLACAAAACGGEPAAPAASAAGAPVAANESSARAGQASQEPGARARKKAGQRGGAAGTRAAPATPAERGPFQGLEARSLSSADGELVHDFGSVPAGRTVRHVFAFRWEGATPLLPTRLRSDCGCLGALLYSQGADGRPVQHELNTPLAPQELFVVELEVDTSLLRGQARKAATLFSEDPPGVLRLVMSGEVRE